MPAIRNSELIKEFTDLFELKTNDFLESEAGRMLVPVINTPVRPTIKRFTFNGAVGSLAFRATVPTGKKWKILNLGLDYVASAEAGNRTITVEIQPVSGFTVHAVQARNVQIASTTEFYTWIAGFSDVSEIIAGFHILPLPSGIMLEGHTIFVLDFQGVSETDSMKMELVVEETSIFNKELIEITGP